MWFEILPSIGVMFTAMTLGLYAGEFMPWLFLNGHRQYKDLNNVDNVAMYHRDERLHGLTGLRNVGKGPYYPKGLENIPDEPEATSE